MQTKLTLRLDDSLINRAKNYAKSHDKSLSQVVAGYFQALSKETISTARAPITQSLIGVIDPSVLDESDYKEHLEEKFL